MVAIVVAVVAAAGYLATQNTSYDSYATVQLRAATAGQSQTTTAVLPVYTDAQLVTSPVVLSAAAKAVGVSSAANLPASVSAAFNALTAVMTIRASSGSASDSQSVANAVSNAYVTQQKAAEATNLADLTKKQAQALVQYQAAAQAAAGSPKDQVLQTKASISQQNYTALSTEVTNESTAAAAAQPQQSAGLGVVQNPEKVKVISLAAVVGLLLGAGMALLREPFDTRVRDVVRAEGISHAAVLSELPNVRAFRRDSNPLPVQDQPRSPFAAGIRELRTSAQVLMGGVSAPVLVVTSPSPMDGKTVVAANLAASYALSGKRTVLISGDMRRPRIDSFFDGGQSGKKSGLAELLDSNWADWEPGASIETERARGLASRASGANPLSPNDEQRFGHSVAESLFKTQIPQLWLMPAGQVRRDPADALAGPFTASMLSYLRSVADVIVIDSPPVLAAADTAILSSVADGVLLVARVGKTDTATLADAIRRLEGSRAPLLGLVLNRSRTEAAIHYRDYYVDTPAASLLAVRPADEAPAPVPPLRPADQPVVAPGPAGAPAPAVTQRPAAPTTPQPVPASGGTANGPARPNGAQPNPAGRPMSPPPGRPTNPPQGRPAGPTPGAAAPGGAAPGGRPLPPSNQPNGNPRPDVKPGQREPMRSYVDRPGSNIRPK